jgi:hypothetical protein
MSKNNVQRLGGRSLFLLALCAGVCLGLPGWAAEKGTMKSLGVLVTIKQDTYKVEDKAGHSILYAEVDGLNLDQSGGKFLDKARYQAIWISDSSGMGSGGYKIFTEADGSKVFAKYEDTEQTGPVTTGQVRVHRGNGQVYGYQGRRRLYIHDWHGHGGVGRAGGAIRDAKIEKLRGNGIPNVRKQTTSGPGK